MSLTPQQEAFARGVANGKSQSESYRLAYPKSQAWKPESVHPKASELAANDTVAARIAEIKAELAAVCLWTREDSARALIGVIKAPDKKSDVVAAIKVLNEMEGHNAPKKVEHLGGGNVIVAVSFDKGGPGAD